MSIMSKIDWHSIILDDVFPHEHPNFDSAFVAEAIVDNRAATKDELRFINNQHDWLANNVLQIIEEEWVHYMY